MDPMDPMDPMDLSQADHVSTLSRPYAFRRTSGGAVMPTSPPRNSTHAVRRENRRFSPLGIQSATPRLYRRVALSNHSRPMPSPSPEPEPEPATVPQMCDVGNPRDKEIAELKAVLRDRDEKIAELVADLHAARMQLRTNTGARINH